jgi:hypothetical protein
MRQLWDLFTHQLETLFGKHCCQNVDDQHVCCQPHIPRIVIAWLVLPTTSTHCIFWLCPRFTGSDHRGLQTDSTEILFPQSLNALCLFLCEQGGQQHSLSTNQSDSKSCLTPFASEACIPETEMGLIKGLYPSHHKK